jgi:hypothetical protein
VNLEIWLTRRPGSTDSRDGDDRSTHKWMVYVRGPAEVRSAPNLTWGRSSCLRASGIADSEYVLYGTVLAGTRHQSLRQEGEVLPPPQLCTERCGRSFASALSPHATRYTHHLRSVGPLESHLDRASNSFSSLQDGANFRFACNCTSWIRETSRWTSSITSRCTPHHLCFSLNRPSTHFSVIF